MSLLRIRQEDEEVLRGSLPYRGLKGLAQDEAEPVPLAPFLFTMGFLGLLGYLISKRPFG